MRSSHGEIEVFLCPDDPGVRTSHSPSSVTTQQTSQHHQQPQSPIVTFKTPASASLPPELLINNCVNNTRTTESLSMNPEPAKIDHQTSVKLELVDSMSLLSSTTGMRDALLCESDDYGPMGGGRFQLQTEDQHSSSGKNQHSLPNN